MRACAHTVSDQFCGGMPIMSQGWTVGRKLFTGVGALATLVMLGGAVSFWQLSGIKRELDKTAKVDARKLELALMIDASTTGLLVEERGLMLGALANDPAVQQRSRQQLTSGLSEAKQSIAEIE